MIIVEVIQSTEPGGLVLTKTYSDAGFFIRQDETGSLYEEAYDPQSANRTYTETDIPIEHEETETEIYDKAEGYDILMGVSE